MPSSPTDDLYKRITLPQKPEGWGYAFATDKHLVSLADAEQMKELLFYFGHHAWLVTTPQSDTFEVLGQRPIEEYLPNFKRPTSFQTLLNSLWKGIHAEHSAAIWVAPALLLSTILGIIALLSGEVFGLFLLLLPGVLGYQIFSDIYGRFAILSNRLQESYSSRVVQLYKVATRPKRGWSVLRFLVHSALLFTLQSAIWLVIQADFSGNPLGWLFQDVPLIYFLLPLIIVFGLNTRFGIWISLLEMMLLSLAGGAIALALHFFAGQDIALSSLYAMLLLPMGLARISECRMEQKPLWYSVIVDLAVLGFSAYLLDLPANSIIFYLALPYAFGFLVGLLKPKSNIIESLLSNTNRQIPYEQKQTQVTYEKWKAKDFGYKKIK